MGAFTADAEECGKEAPLLSGGDADEGGEGAGAGTRKRDGEAWRLRVPMGVAFHIAASAIAGVVRDPSVVVGMVSSICGALMALLLPALVDRAYVEKASGRSAAAAGSRAGGERCALLAHRLSYAATFFLGVMILLGLGVTLCARILGTL